VEIVYSYGVLYHLSAPAAAIEWLAGCAQSMLLLETCVNPLPSADVCAFEEQAGWPQNAFCARH
jgi:hypothetical protein